MNVAPRPAPGPDEVHVWWIDLVRMPEETLAILSPDERNRAERFRRPPDRARWVGARVSLRQILAGYLGISPADVTFDRESIGTAHCASTAACRHTALTSQLDSPSPIAIGEEGRGVRAKPALLNDPRLRFNLAHAGERAVLAVAWEREVGIDLEAVDANLDVAALLPVACTPAETARVEALPPTERVEAFLRLWTLKEAYLKAIGVGLFREPPTLEIDMRPGGDAGLRDLHPDAIPAIWRLRPLDAGPGWVAALAVAGVEAEIRSFKWPQTG